MRVPTSALRALYQPAGILVILWGMMDVASSELVSIVYARAGGRHKEREVPHQLKRKTTFLRRCFQQIEALKPYRTDALGILDAIQFLKIYRECFAHGYPAQFDEKTGEYTFLKVEPEKIEQWPAPTHAPYHFVCTAAHIHTAASETIETAKRLTLLLERLRHAAMPEDGQNHPADEPDAFN